MRRPTTPFCEWKLAIDLGKTRSIQDQKNDLSMAIEGGLLLRWQEKYKSIIHSRLSFQLERIGISIVHPTKIYRYSEEDDGDRVRLTFHAVGVVLEGPNQWMDTDLGKMLMYRRVGDSDDVTAVVILGRQSLEKAPNIEGVDQNDMICLDFRLKIPS